MWVAGEQVAINTMEDYIISTGRRTTGRTNELLVRRKDTLHSRGGRTNTRGPQDSQDGIAVQPNLVLWCCW